MPRCAGAGRAAEVRRQEGLSHRDGVIRRIKGVGIRSEHRAGVARAARLEIGLEGARVPVEVLDAIELQGIDEDRDHGGATLAGDPVRLVDQGEVPGMKGAHRGDEHHRFAPIRPGLAERGKRRVDIHGRLPSPIRNAGWQARGTDSGFLPARGGWGTDLGLAGKDPDQ